MLGSISLDIWVYYLKKPTLLTGNLTVSNMRPEHLLHMCSKRLWLDRQSICLVLFWEDLISFRHSHFHSFVYTNHLFLPPSLFIIFSKLVSLSVRRKGGLWNLHFHALSIFVLLFVYLNKVLRACFCDKGMLGRI